MAHLTARVSADVLAALEQFQVSRGIADRSEALRRVILEAGMDPEKRDTVPDRGEILEMLAASARGGSVTAMKALLDEQRRDDSNDTPKSTSAIDELASRRVARAG